MMPGPTLPVMPVDETPFRFLFIEKCAPLVIRTLAHPDPLSG